MRRLIVLALLGGLTLTGCAGQGQRVKGSLTVIGKSADSKPEWANKGHWKKDGREYFVGTVNDVKDLTVGKEQAMYVAKKVIASSIREVIQGAFETANSGSNQLGRSALGQTLGTALAATIDRVQVVGVVPEEFYWEHLEQATADGVTHGYNVMALVALPDSDYHRAKAAVLEGIAGTEQIKADSQAKELLDKVRGRLIGQ